MAAETTKDQLQALGEEKYLKVVNALMQGTGATTVARMVQGWGDFAGVPEATMVQKIIRFRQVLVRESLGTVPPNLLSARTLEKYVKTDLDAKMVTLQSFRKSGTKLNVLTELVAIVGLQQSRIDRFLKNETAAGKINGSLSMLIEDYKRLLLDIQKVHFDLGMDEFKGVIPGMRGASMTTTTADGTTTQRTVFEAANLMDTIFHTRGIPDPQQVLEANP